MAAAMVLRRRYCVGDLRNPGHHHQLAADFEQYLNTLQIIPKQPELVACGV